MNKIVRWVKNLGWLGGAAALCFFYPGCVSLMEKTGQALDGTAFAEKKIAVYRSADMELREMRNKAGERSVVITLGRFPAARLRGSAPDGGGVFHLSSLDYLGGSVSGWNEYRLDLSGSGKLSLGETSAVLSVPEKPEAVQIEAGKIRRYDTRITGSEALTYLRNRRERVMVLAEWMKERENVPAADSLKNFENYWKPVLFPETVSQKKRPEGWQREGDAFAKAEDIKWNTGYTERLFPENLRAVRNSGTLLRDWEEALDWIYLEYEWDNFFALLENDIILTKAK